MIYSEAEIWEQFKNGDVKAFEQIYDRYSRQLYRYGCGFSFEQALVEDCIQELFTELWNKRQNLGQTTSIRFYLLRSMRRMLSRKVQRDKKRFDCELNFEDAFQHEISQESVYILHEQERELQLLLKNVLNSLPVRQREVMYLRYYQNWTFDEIARLMDIPKKTAYNIVFLALESLRKKLDISSSRLLGILISVIYIS